MKGNYWQIEVSVIIQETQIKPKEVYSAEDKK